MLWIRYFPTLMHFHAPEQQCISWMAERALLTPMNSSVDQINAIISQELLPGEATMPCSAESMGYPRDSTRFSVEFLNKLTPAGLPPHQLYIEKVMVLLFQQNLSPKKGLCNGTRITLKEASSILIYCKIASGDYTGEEVLIPRIEIKIQHEQFIACCK